MALETGWSDGQTVEAKAFNAFVADIKDFRKEIDASIQRAERYLDTAKVVPGPLLAAREMALVRTKLQEAKMWAGKILEVAGNPFPPELADKAEAR